MTIDKDDEDTLKQTARNYDMEYEAVETVWQLSNNMTDFYERLEEFINNRRRRKS